MERGLAAHHHGFTDLTTSHQPVCSLEFIMSGKMRRYDRMLKFRIARALKPSYYTDYNERKRELKSTDPSALSRRYLNRLLRFVGTYNSYYAAVGTATQELRSWPILTKEIIRSRFDDLQSTKRTGCIYKNSSGGAIGEPVTLIQDDNYRRWSARTQEYYFREFLDVEWNCVKNLWLWGSDRDLRRLKSWRSRGGMFLRNRLMLNTFETNDQRWLDYIDRIRSYRPYFVAGYAGSLYQMARVARQYNVNLYRPRFLYSSAELLQNFMRAEIEEQFDTKVYDFYGSREVGAIAGECSEGRRHVFIMNNIVEVVDGSDRTVSEGEEGKIVITNLHNLSMPMIRYAIGDTGTLSVGGCPCGSPLPVLKMLTGRVTDHFRVRDGGLVHGEFFTHLFYLRDWVDQFQVEQVDYDRVNVSVVTASAPPSGDVVEITAKIRAVMGEDCVVDWRYVKSIQTTAQGKRVYTRCLVDR